MMPTTHHWPMYQCQLRTMRYITIINTRLVRLNQNWTVITAVMVTCPDCYENENRQTTALHKQRQDVSTRDGGIRQHHTCDTGDKCIYHKTTVSAKSAISVLRRYSKNHAIITLARFFGRSGGGLCRLARARNASATRWECDWIIPFQPGVSITSVAWLQIHKHKPFLYHLNPFYLHTNQSHWVKYKGLYSRVKWCSFSSHWAQSLSCVVPWFSSQLTKKFYISQKCNLLITNQMPQWFNQYAVQPSQ